jgi:hypothetical protein
MTRKFCAALACIFIALAASSASAATISRLISFSVGGFSAAAPYDTVSGSFVVTLDPLVDDLGVVTDFTSNLPAIYGQDVKFSYDLASGFAAVGQGAFAGGLVYPPNSAPLGIGVLFFIDAAFTTISPTGGFVYSAGGNQYVSSSVVRAEIGAAGVVPEPGTWAMLVLGLGGTGAALRAARRSRWTAAA